VYRVSCAAEPIEMPLGEGLTHVGTKNHVLDGAPPEGQFWGLEISAAVYAAKRDNSINSNEITVRQLQPTAMLPTARYQITLSPVKNLPPSNAAFRRFLDHLLVLLLLWLLLLLSYRPDAFLTPTISVKATSAKTIQ